MIGGRREYMARFMGGVIRSTVQNRPLPDSNEADPDIPMNVYGSALWLP
jgi:hypothetical protein